MNAQENYDQLKRRNRRRLVGALIMVIVAVVLLMMMFNRQSSKQIEPPKLDVVNNNPNQAETNRTKDPISDVVIQEPVSSISASVPLQSTASAPIVGTQTTTQASVPRPQTNLPSSGTANYPTGTQTGHVNENETKHTQSTAQVIGSHPKTDSGNHKTPVDKENIKTPPTANIKGGAGDKKNVTNGTPAKDNKNTSIKQLTPQEILENKAANQVTAPAQVKKQASTTATVNTPVERTIIQVGAYTTEAQAKLVQQKLAAIGINCSISSGQTSKGTLYRVRSGIYNSRALALQNLNKIQAAGLNGMVIGL